MEESIILVDRNDNETGVAEKLATHRRGDLHRAVSVFVFDSQGNTLLQKRAVSKYHSGGLWSNACCSHPRPGETTRAAAGRRLNEEMGITCDLIWAFDTLYQMSVGNDLIEHEYDHVYIGKFDGRPRPSREEVEHWQWISMEDLREDLARNPERYTRWLNVLFDKLCARGRATTEHQSFADRIATSEHTLPLEHKGA